MLVRSHRHFVARALLLVVLFAQAAIAMAACELPGRTPAQAFAEEPAMPCHEAPAEPKNICLAHCLSTDQSADTPYVAVPARIDVPPLVVAVVEPFQHASAALRRVPPHAAAPPPRILFQSFLI
jgi:hypothetical protein